MAKIIAFAQQKGGSGKTTLLTQIATALAAEGAAVAAIDLDLQRSLSGWGGARGRGGARAPVTVSEADDWRVAAAIREAGKAHDFVLIDCPGSADILLQRTLRESDLVIVPVQPSAPDVWASHATLAQARKEAVPARLALNRVPPRGRLTDGIAETLAAGDGVLFETRIGARVAFADAFARGAGVVETASSSKAAAEIAALTAEIRRTLG